MITRKSINHSLPRIDAIRSHYILRGTVGPVPKYATTFKCAYADTDDGFVTLYGVGEAMEARHYRHENCIDVTEIIEDWIRGEIERHEVVNAIYEKLTGTND